MPVATLPSPARPLVSAPSKPPSALAPARVKLGPVGRGPHAPKPPACPPPQAEPVRLTRRGLVLAWVLCLVAVGLVCFGLMQGLARSEPGQVAQRTITVGGGQSAWELAESVNPSVDPRITIAAVERLNGLESLGVVQPGQRLVVPVFGAG